MSSYQPDQALICIDCKGDYVISAEERMTLTEKALRAASKRCQDCRQAQKVRSTDFSLRGAKSTKGW